MDEEGKPDQFTPDNVLQPPITREYLEKFWIGFGAATNWIAMRGQPTPEQMYLEREDAADETLVAVLADLPPVIAEALVRGVPEDKLGSMVPIPSGIWPQTATSDANDAGKPYRLIGTDDHCEWDGSIHSLQGPSYRRIQIRADFIRDNWPEHKKDIEPQQIRPVVARAQLRRLIENIVEITPVDLAPLTQREIHELTKRCIPAASRDLIRQFYRELMPNIKAGPRGPRDPKRELRIKELSDKLMAAQLLN
jgi:hypothetical protein